MTVAPRLEGGEGLGEVRAVAVRGDGGEVAGFGCGSVRGLRGCGLRDFVGDEVPGHEGCELGEDLQFRPAASPVGRRAASVCPRRPEC